MGRSRTLGEGAGLGFSLLLESILLQKVSVDPAQPLVAEEMLFEGGLVCDLRSCLCSRRNHLAKTYPVLVMKELV